MRSLPEPRSGAFPSTITEPSRRTSHPPFPSGRIAKSTTADWRSGTGAGAGGAVGVVLCTVVVVTSTGPDVVVVGREVVVGLGRVVVPVCGAFGVVADALVAVIAGGTVVVVPSAALVVELVDASAGRRSACPRLAADTSTLGLSPFPAQPVIPSATTRTTPQVRFTPRGSGWPPCCPPAAAPRGSTRAH